MALQVYLESLGCARNQVDSEIMQSELEAAGCLVIDAADQADVIIVNTCSFIESAADESIDTILALAANKKQGRCRKLIVAGCLPERYREDSAAAMPEVDLFLGTGAYSRITAAVLGGLASGTCLLPDPDTIDVGRPVGRRPFNPYAAYLKIAEGCTRRCTYCIIPRLRGRQKSRLPQVILSEARALVEAGVRELTLVAQETTAYGTDLPDRQGLAALLAALAAMDKKVWIRFLYGHPESLEPAVLETVARHPNICPYFDIPIQHASTSVLRSMGRRYDADKLIRQFDTIRAAVPEAVLRTTVLVGFPGETEGDFSQLCDLIDRVAFDHLGAFAYSDAEDLPSHALAGHVPHAVAQRRVAAVMRRQQEISARNLTRYLGRSLDVLVESGSAPEGWSGRTRYQAPEVDGQTLIRAPNGEGSIITGSIIPVRILETTAYDLLGEPIKRHG